MNGLSRRPGRAHLTAVPGTGTPAGPGDRFAAVEVETPASVGMLYTAVTQMRADTGVAYHAALADLLSTAAMRLAHTRNLDDAEDAIRVAAAYLVTTRGAS